MFEAYLNLYFEFWVFHTNEISHSKHFSFKIESSNLVVLMLFLVLITLICNLEEMEDIILHTSQKLVCHV